MTVPGQGEIDVTGDRRRSPDTSRGQREEGDFDVVRRRQPRSAYRLCGSGDNCSIAIGTPSPSELQLLRREALELSLYTFKYVKDVDSVVVFLPPPPPSANAEQQTSGTLFLRRERRRAELELRR